MICTAGLLAACADDSATYPSLARRPVERISGTSAVVPAQPAPTPLPPPSPASTARLGALVAQAQAAHQRFTQRSASSRALVNAAKGAAVASESWSIATVALADLESARSEAMIALADLDQLYAAARVDGNDAAAAAQARDEVLALIATEDLVLADLRQRLRA